MHPALGLDIIRPLVTHQPSRSAYLQSVLTVLSSFIPCRCIGIRVINSDGTMPYDAYVGFSREFWDAENWISYRTDDCTCTRLAAGTKCPDDGSTHTPYGSVWTADLQRLADGITGKDAHVFRGKCVESGFGSLALIPLRYRGEALGLVHCADAAPNLIDAGQVAAVEQMAPLVAEMIGRYNDDEYHEKLRHDFQEERGHLLSEIERERDRLRALVEALTEEVWFFDRDGTLVYLNPAARLGLGFDGDIAAIEEALGRLETRTSGLSGSGAATIFNRRTGTDGECGEEVVRHPVTGEWRHRQFRLSPLRSAAGGQVGSLIVVTDVTEQKRALAALEKSEQLHKAVVENVADAIIVTDPEGNIVTMNRTFRERRGHGKKSLLDISRRFQALRPDGSLVPMEEWPALRAARGETVKDVVMHVVDSRSGSTMIGRYNAVPLVSPDGQVENVVITVHDMTEMQKAFDAVEEEVKLRTQELSDTVVQLRHEVEQRVELQRQLVHAQKMEALGSVAGGIAHEFNNLLMTMCGFTENARDAADDELIRDDLAHVLAAGRRAKQLTQKLLTFSRQQVLEMKVVDVNELVRNQVQFLSGLGFENVTYALDIPASAAYILCDPVQVELVVMNLVINGRDAMPSGGTLTVTAETVRLSPGEADGIGLDAAGEYAKITIADTGSGIPAEHLERIFEPFFTTKQGRQASGLGLSTVYGVMKQHRGMITVASAIGGGTTFSAYFPIASQDSVPASRPDGAADAGRRVLVVEDDQSVLMYLVMTLRRGGYSVWSAGDGVEALEVLQTLTVDLVLADVMMPRMTGMELFRELRQRKLSLKMILMSGYSSDIVSESGLKETDVAFLQKPVSKETLFTTIRQTLAQDAAR